MQENNPNNLKSFFIKLISITIAVIIVFNVVFNLIFAQRLEKIDKIFSIFETQERKDIKNKIISELEKGLEKEEIINKEDKIIILKTYNKIKKEFKNLDTN
jgi:hypothetical protein